MLDIIQQLRTLTPSGAAMGSGDSSRSSRPTLSIGDRLFVACFVLFGVTSFVFEPFVVVGCGGDGGLAACRDHGGTVGYLWWWYAASFDPVFLNTPPWLRVMCALDWLLFGACYVALIIGFMQRALWVRYKRECDLCCPLLSRLLTSNS